MKKTFGLLVVALLVVCNVGVLSFAATTAYPNVTFESSDDFTIVRDANTPETIKAMGLTSSYAKVGFNADEIDCLVWRTSDPSVIKFNYWWIFNSSTIYDKDEVKLVTTGSGDATVTVTYNPPNGDPVSVSSYVVVENGQITSSVSNIDTVVAGTVASTQLTNTGSVPLFDLNDVFGAGFDDADVLKETPTVLHALLFNLELKNDPDGATSITDSNWDWDWVSANVNITSQGSFVTNIGTDVNKYPKGWQYKLNNASIQKASSVSDLTSSDDVNWFFGTY